MSENKCTCGGSLTQREAVCIDTQRILDSCKDRDCYEDQKVWLTEYGQDVIDHTTVIRVRRAEIIRANVSVEPVDFSRGFYRVSVRYYIKLVFEGCVCKGNSREFDGIVVLDKSVVLFGSEGSVHIFRSSCEDFCGGDDCSADCGTNAPTAVVETVDPVVLSVRVAEAGCRSCCVCGCNEVPENVWSCLSGSVYGGNDRRVLLVSLGIFSVIRIERPAQLLVNAATCAVPEKECRNCVDDTSCDPCRIFREMDFPVNEFAPPSACTFEKRVK